MNFTIGQVKIRIGLGLLEVVAPIGDHAVQVSLIQITENRGGYKVQLFVDAHYKGEIEVRGDGIPF